MTGVSSPFPEYLCRSEINMRIFNFSFCFSGLLKKKSVLCSVAGMAAVVSLSACSDSPLIAENEAEKSDKVYKIMTEVAFPPLSWEDEEGNLRGIDLEVFAAVAEKTGISYEMKPANFKDIMHSLAVGNIDGVICSVSYTEDRSKLYDFSDSYFRSSSVVVGTHNLSGEINSVEDLKGRSMVAKTATLGAEWGEANRDLIGDLQLFPVFPEVLLNIDLGLYDFTITDAPYAKYFLSSELYPNLTIVKDDIFPNDKSNDYYFIVRKGATPELLEAFNRGLKMIRSDGTYDAIIKKYLGDSSEERQMYNEEISEN